jgi:hypothetical protein
MFHKKTYKVVALALFMLALGFVSGGKAHAATITVHTDLNPSVCSLDEAIENINDQADTNGDCVETGSYGTNDTIAIPEGEVLLTADLPQFTKSITIQGSGIGETVINGDGQWQPLSFESPNLKTASISGITITEFNRAGISGFDGQTIFTVDQVEVDGTGSSTDLPIYGGIAFAATGVNHISNVYIHNINFNQSGLSPFGIGAIGGQNSVGTLNVSNTTISDLGGDQTSPSAITLIAGVVDDSNTPATINLNIANSTIDNIHSSSASASGINAFGIVDGGETNFNIVSKNNTLRNISGRSGDTDSGALSFIAGSLQSSDEINVNYESTNTVYSDNTSDGVASTCMTLDGSSLIGGLGVVSMNITSQGGNLSDDTTCQDYFTQPTDQNNLTTLATTLGTLSDNGGFVPTIALLENSPAVDAGVTVAGLTTDARLALRPQGSAYDSGAYESPFTKAGAVQASLASTGEDTTMISLGSLLAVLVSFGLLAAHRAKFFS